MAGIDIIVARSHHYAMRTTINLDDDILKEAGRRARILNVSLGKAVSDLARRGLQAAPPLKEEDGLMVFDPPKESPRITRTLVKEGLADYP